MKPLHARSLDPLRRIFNVPGMDIERRADTDHDLASQRSKIFSHELFLFGRTQPDPDDIWSKP